MITLEAFITKKNLKQSVKANELSMNYSDINFIDPTADDANALTDLLKENGLMPEDDIMVDKREVRMWTMRPAHYYRESPKVLTLYMQYGVKGHINVFSVPVLMFKIGEDDFDDDLGEILRYVDFGAEFVRPRDKKYNPQLYKICENIAKGMGFTTWNESKNGWIK